jgi:hypothetical protein
MAQFSPGVLFRDNKADDRRTAAFQGVGVVVFQNFARQFFVALKAGDVLGEFVVEHVGEPLVKDQGQDEILELGRVGGPANLAGSVPELLLQLVDVELLGTGRFNHDVR